MADLLWKNLMIFHPLFCFQELNNVSLFIAASLSEKKVRIGPK